MGLYNFRNIVPLLSYLPVTLSHLDLITLIVDSDNV